MKAAFKENPDVFHAHDFDALICLFLPALLKRKILIYDSHELWSEVPPIGNLRQIRFLIIFLEKIAMIKVKKGITVNESLAKYLHAKYQKTFIYLLNVPDLIKSKLSYSLKKKYPQKKIILHLGATGKWRGAEQIIKSAQYLPSSIMIVFIGAGRQKEILEKLIQKLGVEKKIALLESVLPDEILSVAKEADLGLALTQNVALDYYYSLPNKLFQYLAAEVPILGSNFPEFKKIIIGNGIGEMVNPAKPKLIAQKIMVMLKKQNQTKYHQNLKGLARKKYNWQTESQKLISFYKGLL